MSPIHCPKCQTRLPTPVESPPGPFPCPGCGLKGHRGWNLRRDHVRVTIDQRRRAARRDAEIAELLGCGVDPEVVADDFNVSPWRVRCIHRGTHGPKIDPATGARHSCSVPTFARKRNG